MRNIQLSENFWLNEFTRSQTAVRHGIDMTPPPAVVDNLYFLCREILEPIRFSVGAPFVVTSGYRPPKLNKAINGSKTSGHRLGLCSDGYFPGVPLVVAAQTIMGAPRLEPVRKLIDQLIYEGRWLHIGAAWRSRKPRNEILTAHFEPGGVRYTEGIA